MNKKSVPFDRKNSDKGTMPTPELLQTIEMTIRKAIKEKEEGKVKVIVFILGEHGLLDMEAYQAYLPGNIEKESDQGRNFSFGVAC